MTQAPTNPALSSENDQKSPKKALPPVKTVPELTEFQQKYYNLHSDEAFKRLEALEITKNPQVMLGWIREGLIDAIRLGKGAGKDRYVRVAEQSLNNFIQFKQATPSDWLRRIAELQAELDKQKEENKELRKQLREAKKENRGEVAINDLTEVEPNVWTFKPASGAKKGLHRLFISDGVTTLERNTKTGPGEPRFEEIEDAVVVSSALKAIEELKTEESDVE